MNNLTINIHFFRNSQNGYIPFDELKKFFLSHPNFEIEYDDKELNIIYSDHEFGFKYMYQLSKISKVKGVYKLDAAYLNVNFMLCLPLLIPSFAVKEILGFALKLSKAFDLKVYHESFTNVKQFNIADIYSLFSVEQRKYLETNSPVGKVFYEADRLNTICKFQRNLESINANYRYEISVNPCKPILDRANNEFGISTIWNAGIPTLFAPYFDYVDVKDENGESFLVRRTDFIRTMDKYLTRVEDSFPDMYLIKAKAAKQSRGMASRLRRYAIVDQTFEEIPICDLLDKY